jgi:integrase
MGHLTKQIVESCRQPSAGQTFVRDDAIRGLALRVTANGSKSFVWEGRVKGRMHRITLGQFPAVSVTLAREKALEIKAAIARGEDPALDHERKREEQTFKGLAERYLEHHAKPHKKSWRRDDSRIAAHFDKWSGRRLSDISADDVMRLHQAIADEHGRVEANRSITLLRSMFNLARDWGNLIGPNPAERVKLFHEDKRDRFLSPEELRRVNDALAEEASIYWRAYFVLSLLLGTRKNELLAARWSDVNLDQRTWRIPTTKAGRPHLLPLPAAAVDLLNALPSLQERREFIFPGDGSTGHLVEPRKAWERIRKRAGLPDVWIHDLRRTLGSWLAAQGHSLPLIGRALNHTNASSTAIYARLDLDPVREALEKNAALMLERRTPAG